MFYVLFSHSHFSRCLYTLLQTHAPSATAGQGLFIIFSSPCFQVLLTTNSSARAGQDLGAPVHNREETESLQAFLPLAKARRGSKDLKEMKKVFMCVVSEVLCRPTAARQHKILSA